jgi:hypothetical protein
VTSAPIVLGFSAYRALVEFEGGVGWVDLSSASSSRTDMSLCAKGLRRARVEQLILEMRAAMVGEQPRVEGAGNDRIEVCRTA